VERQQIKWVAYVAIMLAAVVILAEMAELVWNASRVSNVLRNVVG
jgi:hypothetical protein